MAVKQQRRTTARARPRSQSKTTRALGPRGKTMFFPPKNPTLAEIISIRSPAEARASIRKLDSWADDDVERLRKAIRSATLAANRAEVSTRRKVRPLSPKEKTEMLRVAETYRRGVKILSRRLATRESGGRRQRRMVA
jgi:hypothetical protein